MAERQTVSERSGRIERVRLACERVRTGERAQTDRVGRESVGNGESGERERYTRMQSHGEFEDRREEEEGERVEGSERVGREARDMESESMGD